MSKTASHGRRGARRAVLLGFSCLLHVATARVFSTKNVTLCNKDVREMQAVSVSQDTLYNIALGTCMPGSIVDWHYDSAFTTTPPRMVVEYDIPASARLHCSSTRVSCSISLPGALNAILPHVKTLTQSTTCVRGVHIYSLWQVSQEPIIRSLELLQDVQLEPTAHRAHVRTATDGDILWPFSLLQTAIYDKVIATAEDASNTYAKELCRDYGG